MKFPFKYFITLSLIIVFFALGAWYVISEYAWPKPAYLPLTIGVLYVLTFISHMFVRVSALSRGKPFVQLISISMVLRITVYGLFALLIIIFNPGDPASDLIYFACLYLILTIHELVDVVRNPLDSSTPKTGE